MAKTQVDTRLQKGGRVVRKYFKSLGICHRSHELGRENYNEDMEAHQREN